MRATWHALITQAFLPPPVLKVISSDYVSVHPGLGVMGGVECFECLRGRLTSYASSVCIRQLLVFLEKRGHPH